MKKVGQEEMRRRSKEEVVKCGKRQAEQEMEKGCGRLETTLLKLLSKSFPESVRGRWCG